MTSGQFVEPVSHEGDIHLIFTEDDLAPYYALNSVIRSGRSSEKWETEGKPTARMNHRGETFKLAADYDDQPLLPWNDPSYEMESVPLFRIYFASCDRLSDDDPDTPADQSPRTVGGTITIRPRWPGMKKEDGSDIRGIPNLNSGSGYIDCQIQASNIPHREYKEILQTAFAAFDIVPRYVADPHESSNISDMARYVRLRRSASSPVHSADGPIARTHAVLEPGQTGFRKHVEDHTELPGYYVSTVINDGVAGDIIKGHRLGKEVKHYYPNHPHDREPDDPLYHPKLEVSYQTSRTEDTLYWDDLQSARRELDETILNYLEWSSLSVRPADGKGDEPFFSDPVFTASESHRSAKIVDCPLPDIKDEQTAAVMSLWGSATESDRDLIDSLVSDGGRPDRAELADRTEYSYRTVRRFVQRCEQVVSDTMDGLSIGSKHQEAQLLERVRASEESFRKSIEHAVLSAADAAEGRARSKWNQLKQKYNIRLRDTEFKQKLDIGYSPADKSEAIEIIGEIKIQAYHRFESLRRVELHISCLDGWNPTVGNLASWSKPAVKTSGGSTTEHQTGEPLHRRLDSKAREIFNTAFAELPKSKRETVKAEISTR